MLSTLLAALPHLLPLIRGVPEVARLVRETVQGLPGRDQAIADEALEALMEENDEGHRRYQEKLAEAAGR